MTTRLILIITTLLLIFSCSKKTSKILEEKLLTGTINNGQFDNHYLTMDVLDGWTEVTGNDETQFLIINKEKSNFKSNIILLGLDKNQYREIYGFQSAEHYMVGLTDNFKSKPEYRLISAMDSVKIDERTFFVSRFMLVKGDKEYKQSCFGIVATEDYKELEPEVEEIIKSIKFKY